MVVVTGNENKVSPMDNDLLDITKLRRWRIWKLKLIDARLYFVSIFVGLLTGLVAVPYHYLLQQLFNSRKLFFDGHYPWYFHVLFFFTLWGILLCVNWMVKKMPLITGGGIPQTRAVINGRITYKNPLTQLIAKFTGGILAISAGLSLGREGPCVQIRILRGEYHFQMGTRIGWRAQATFGRRRRCRIGRRFRRSPRFLTFGDRVHRTVRRSQDRHYHLAGRGRGGRRSELDFSLQPLLAD